ncbi:MAG TPA: sialidase family protein [Puia sp.]|nr:sialidase family protein [Puia sp.]
MTFLTRTKITRGGADCRTAGLYRRSPAAWLCCLAGILFLSAGSSCAKRTATPGTGDSTATSSRLAAPIHTSMVLFNGGNEGAGGVTTYHSFRIPSIVKTNNGTLIAFAEGRRWSPSDYGDINLVYKRSTDNGATWSALGEVVGTGPGTWGNPTAVYDWNQGSNGRVWLFMNWNDSAKHAISDFTAWGDRRVYVSHSDDHGATWSTPVDLTATLTPSTYKWDAMGPGVGIQTTVDHPGRLIIPAYGRNIYSDDHGVTWSYQLLSGGKHESTIVELLDGTLLRNDRPNSTEWAAAKRRVKATGSISGGFGAWTADAALTDPMCEGSIIRYNASAPTRIIFLNPNSESQRCNMTARISYDEGATWQRSRSIYDWNTCDYTAIEAGNNIAKGGYSSMVKTPDFAVGALIEINEGLSNSSTSNKSIEFHKFNLGWILNGASEP